MISQFLVALGLKKPFHDDPWAFLRYTEIVPEDQEGIYLKRFVVAKTPLFGLFLHKFEMGDPESDLHDHPWNFWTFIVKGGYIEVTEDNREYYGIGSLNRRKATDKHRVELLYATTAYTIFLHGPHKREWGFWVDEQFIQWKEYLETHSARQQVSG